MFAPRRAIHTISSAPAPSPPSPSGRTSVPAHQAIRTDENGAFIVRRNENGEISGRTTVVFRDYRAAARVGGGERVGAGERAGERERWAIVGDPLGKLVIHDSQDVHIHLNARLLTSTIEIFRTSHSSVFVDVPAPLETEDGAPLDSSAGAGAERSAIRRRERWQLGSVQLDPPLDDVELSFAHPSNVGSVIFAPAREGTGGGLEQFRQAAEDAQTRGGTISAGSAIRDTASRSPSGKELSADGGHFCARGFRDVRIRVRVALPPSSPSADNQGEREEPPREGEEQEDGARYAWLTFTVDERIRGAPEGRNAEAQVQVEDGEVEQCVLSLVQSEAEGEAESEAEVADEAEPEEGDTSAWEWNVRPLQRRTRHGYPTLAVSTPATVERLRERDRADSGVSGL